MGGAVMYRRRRRIASLGGCGAGINMAGLTATWGLIEVLAAASPRPSVGPGDARLDAVRTTLQATIDQAGARGLPVDALVSKMQEGLAKGAAPTKILAVVQGLATDYAAA